MTTIIMNKDKILSDSRLTESLTETAFGKKAKAVSLSYKGDNISLVANSGIFMLPLIKTSGVLNPEELALLVERAIPQSRLELFRLHGTWFYLVGQDHNYIIVVDMGVDGKCRPYEYIISKDDVIISGSGSIPLLSKEEKKALTEMVKAKDLDGQVKMTIRNSQNTEEAMSIASSVDKYTNREWLVYTGDKVERFVVPFNWMRGGKHIAASVGFLSTAATLLGLFSPVMAASWAIYGYRRNFKASNEKVADFMKSATQFIKRFVIKIDS